MWVTSCFSSSSIYHFARERIFSAEWVVLLHTHKGEGRSNHRKDLFVVFRTPTKAPSSRAAVGEKLKTQKRKEEKNRHRANHHFCHARIRTHARASFSDPSISISLCVFIQYASTSWESEQLESTCVFWNKIRESSRSIFAVSLFFPLL